jgi:hypothetical protein
MPSSTLYWNRAARGATAGLAAVLAVSGAAAASAAVAPAASPSWHTVKQVTGGDFSAVTAVSSTDVWAFTGHTAWQRSGSRWKRMTLPGKKDGTVVAAGASSATNVWAFTAGGPRSRAFKWNGSSWAVAHSFSRQLGGAVVLSRDDIWIFGDSSAAGSMGSWHFNGRAWVHVTSGKRLTGGSGLTAGSVWAFGGTNVAHWNGQTWNTTSVASLLPAKQALNNPSVTAIYAQSATSVWAIGNGNAQDEGGPLAVLHYNGHAWSQVAESGSFGGYGVLGQVASDGQGGLWIPGPGASGAPAHLVHYSAGKLTAAKLPFTDTKINVESVAAIPGTREALAGGFTHAANNLGASVVATVLQYGG